MQHNRRQTQQDRLGELRARAASIVGGYARGSSLPTPRARDGEGSPQVNGLSLQDGAPLGRTRSASGDVGSLSVNVTLSGGPIFLDDERRIRALAKEIKRLLSEDRRRGLGVGG